MAERPASLSRTDSDPKGVLHLDAMKRATLKFDAIVTTSIIIFYFLSFLDRSNIGNARIAGLQQNLNMTDNQFSTALTISFVPYIVMEIPGNLLIKKVGPRIFIPALAMLWGLVAMLQGFVTSYGGLLAVRFFIGLVEGAVQPGMVMYMASFYRRNQLQARMSIFYTAPSIAGAFSGLLAAAIFHMEGIRGLHGWAWLFILEGLLTIVIGAIGFTYLPTTPHTSWFLTNEEKAAVTHMLEEENTLADHHEAFSWSSVIDAFKSPQIWILTPLFFFNGTAAFGLAFFSPTIVQALGNFSPIKTQLLTVPPYAVSFVATTFGAILCDKYGQRGLGIIIYSLLSMIGFALFLTSNNIHVRYLSLFFQTVGGFGVPGTNTAWVANNMAPYYKRATGLAYVLLLSSVGGILSTWIFTDPPEFHRAGRIDIAFVIGQIVFTAINIWYLHRQNQLKAAARARRTERAKESEKASEHDSASIAPIEVLGDLHPDFVYTL